MKAKEIKIKKLSPKEYLNMIRPYLSGVHLGNKVIDYKTLGEWKI